MMYEVNGKVFFHNEPENATECFVKEYYNDQVKWKLKILKEIDLFNTNNLFVGKRRNGKSDFLLKSVLGLIHSKQNINIAIITVNMTNVDILKNNFLFLFNELSGSFHMPKLIKSSKTSLSFSNGNTIYFNNSNIDQFRGISFNHVFVDLSDHFEKDKLYTLIKNIIPMISNKRGSITMFTDKFHGNYVDFKKDFKNIRTYEI